VKHDDLERSSILLLLGILLVVSIGGLVQIAPLFWVDSTIERVQGMRPYTPLEQAGRDIYVREGCYGCHRQMVRTLRDEVERYGHYSLAAESMYDHPFQWGSKRTGPDLARVGGKYSDQWHAEHMINPRTLVPESIMPAYPWLAEHTLDTDNIVLRLRTLKMIGALSAAGCEVEILSGDRAEAVADAARLSGIARWRAEQRPDDKIRRIEELTHHGRKVLMIGDGLNDAPALAAGHASLSPSSAADISQNAANAVFQGERLAPVIETLKVARAARRRSLENFAIAIGYNVAFVPLAIAGLVTPLIAAIAMSASSIAVTADAMRLARRTWDPQP
jgi:cbb3-type cytochrome c oxidase subunit II